MGNKHSKSRKQSKVTVDNQRQKAQEVPPLTPAVDERQTTKSTKNGGADAGHEKLSTRAERAVGLTRSSEQPPSTEVSAGYPVGKGLPSNAGRPPSQEEQHETKQRARDTSIAVSNAATVVGVASGTSRDSSSPNNHNVLPASVKATDGYVSFSESDSEISTSPNAEATTNAATPAKQRPPGGKNDHHDKHTAGGGRQESYHDRMTDDDSAENNDGGGDDMWDFGDDTDDDQAHGGRVVTTVSGGSKTNGSGEQRMGDEVAGIGGDVGGGGDDSIVDEPQQPRVAVDRLGRRENAPRR